jgi:hypothetical protein
VSWVFNDQSVFFSNHQLPVIQLRLINGLSIETPSVSDKKIRVVFRVAG